MISKSIAFCHQSHDPFIDFLKGVSIIFVILNHCIGESMHSKSIYCLWGDAAVPIFLLIQTFHAYKKGLDVEFSFTKVWRRVFKYFIVMQLPLFAFFLIRDNGNIVMLGKNWLSQGGFGSGSYYVWIYLQFAILLPVCAMVIKRLQGWKLFLFFVMICQLSELAFSVAGISGTLYRLLCLRYFFLIYLGYLIAQRGIIVNSKTLLLSFISVVAILVFYYSNYDLRPLFFTDVSYSWRTFHWVSYFYISGFFLFLLNVIYTKTKFFVHTIIEYLGKYSYEIFLFQMFYFAVAQYGTLPFLQGLSHNLSRAIYVCISATICISAVPLFLYVREMAFIRGNR